MEQDQGNQVNLYLPLPFPEYKNVEASRTVKDSEERYEAIKKSFGDFSGKEMLDLCCANGYFMFRFLQDGGMMARGIDNHVPFLETMFDIANVHCLPLTLYESTKNFDRDKRFSKAHIGLYLDTHYHNGTEDYLKWIKEKSEVLFTSSCKMDEAYENDLKLIFKTVEPIHKGFANRRIFRCE